MRQRMYGVRITCVDGTLYVFGTLDPEQFVKALEAVRYSVGIDITKHMY